MSYKGKTVAQSAAKLLERMKLGSARKMADHYADAASDDTPSNDSEPSPACQHWTAVSELLHATSALDLNPIFEQAEKDTAMAQKQTKPTSNTKPTDATPASSDTLEAEAHTRTVEVCKALDRKLTAANNALAQFTEGMKVNPVHALTWGDSTFKAAAQVQVFTYAIQGLTDDSGKPVAVKTQGNPTHGVETWDTVPYIREYAQKEVNRRSLEPSRSTSQCSNMMENYILSAWSEVIEMIDWS